jgi:hypothetical protein
MMVMKHGKSNFHSLNPLIKFTFSISYQNKEQLMAFNTQLVGSMFFENEKSFLLGCASSFYVSQ